MRVSITSVDYAPEELYEQAPFFVDLLRSVRCVDGVEYWLGAVDPRLSWFQNGIERAVTHVVIAPRWVGGRIARGMQHVPVNIAFVTDPTLRSDAQLEFPKVAFVAIGTCEDAAAT